MNILIPLAVASVLFGFALRTYPKMIARAFRENDDTPTPSIACADGKDFVKTKTPVVFGHHFATIAGAGPIVGPTVALAFGWQPVWLWVVLGGIFFGATHDMCAMFASVREGGHSIAEVARRTLGPLGYLLMILALIFVLTIINALFLNLSVKALTSVYPIEKLELDAGQTLLHAEMIDGVANARVGGIATTSVFIITLFAPLLGWLIRKKNLATGMAFLIAGAVAVISIIVGFKLPIILSGNYWAVIMSIYVFFACAIPVWVILQPRDFTNVQILYGGLAMLFICTIIAGLRGRGMDAPAVDMSFGVENIGLMWPMLFITVACGAISGFHSLVASGTSSKQIPRESDCRRVGYGGMILESMFAVLVIIAVASYPRGEYVSIVHPEMGSGNWILGFALGAGHLMHAAIPGIPLAIAAVLGILMIEGFVVTTLDSSIRLCRYMIEEFWRFLFNGEAPALCRHPVFNAGIAVGMMVFFYLNGTLGKMWGVFGAGNQLIGALALTTVSVWLVQRARQHLFALIPAMFMIATTIVALWLQIKSNWVAETPNRVLSVTAAVLLVLAVGVVVVGVSRFAQALAANSKESVAVE